MKNISLTCQRFNVLCAVNFTLRLNFDKIEKGDLPIINRDYSKVILEGTEIPEHLLDSLSTLNLETVSTLQITRGDYQLKGRPKGNKHCRILARSYLKILKIFPNIKVLELDAVRLSVILKSDIIKEDELPNLRNLTFLKTRDVNESVYQCLWKAKNLTNIVARKVTGAAQGCIYFMNLLEQCRTNLKHLEADIFDARSKRFSMDALEYLYFDYIPMRRMCELNFNFWLLDSPMLKTCIIKAYLTHLNGILLNYKGSQSSILTLTIENCLEENVIIHLHKILEKFLYLEKLICEQTVIWEKVKK